MEKRSVIIRCLRRLKDVPMMSPCRKKKRRDKETPQPVDGEAGAMEPTAAVPAADRSSPPKKARTEVAVSAATEPVSPTLSELGGWMEYGKLERIIANLNDLCRLVRPCAHYTACF